MPGCLGGLTFGLVVLCVILVVPKLSAQSTDEFPFRRVEHGQSLPHPPHRPDAPHQALSCYRLMQISLLVDHEREFFQVQTGLSSKWIWR
jgi:hypothetical protein